ncbi:PREDICTED: uncharacterized protein LOC106146331 [Chinchilla lanigera]|uniref:uncharacterized protein LOC106146331 n=1 Tax=Chinchilla lanigera TaxID=34839 RepID=UPI000696F671|nr:PREDICTED: uncharacterized protein LOC106146331 [Chinchilla lanigera]
MSGNLFEKATPELCPAQQDGNSHSRRRGLKPQGTASAKALSKELARQVPGKTVLTELKHGSHCCGQAPGAWTAGKGFVNATPPRNVSPTKGPVREAHPTLLTPTRQFGKLWLSATTPDFQSSNKGRCYLLTIISGKRESFTSQPKRAEKLSLSGWQVSRIINHNKGRIPVTSPAPGRAETDGETRQRLHRRAVEFLLSSCDFYSITRLRPCGRCGPKNKTSRGSRSLCSPAPAPAQRARLRAASLAPLRSRQPRDRSSPLCRSPRPPEGTREQPGEGKTGSHFVAQTGLNHTATLLPQPSNGGITGRHRTAGFTVIFNCDRFCCHSPCKSSINTR